jgi:ArsR family transcriptional regulator, virulence genes transcriptional regulator
MTDLTQGSSCNTNYSSEKKVRLTSDQLEAASLILKAVAHPIRLSILQLLEKEERMSVNDICERIGTEQSLTSHHLSNMKLKGILGSKREGQRVYYYLKLPGLNNLLNYLETCVCCF